MNECLYNPSDKNRTQKRERERKSRALFISEKRQKLYLGRKKLFLKFEKFKNRHIIQQPSPHPFPHPPTLTLTQT